MNCAAPLLSLLCRLALPTGSGAFRLWLALVVVGHHVSRIEIGKAPVLVFFALSGFWVHGVWQERYRRAPLAWASFVLSRWWRMAPVFMLASGLSLAAHGWLGTPDWPLIRESLVAQLGAGISILGYAQLVTRPVGPAWSLDIEIQFYLAAPLLGWLVRRAPAGAVLGVGGLVWLVALASGAGVVLPSFLVFFLLGMVAAEHDWQAPARVGPVGMVMAVGLVGLALLSPWRVALVGEGGDYAALFNLLLGLLVLPFALGTVRRPPDSFDRAMGDHSYLIYLLHWPAIIVLRHGGSAIGFDRVGQWGLAVAVMAVSVVVLCQLVWRWLDRPSERARGAWLQAILRGRASEPAVRKEDDRRHFLA